jgi:hypothetical protein
MDVPECDSAVEEWKVTFMATREQLRALITARPFQPFLIKMASGERFTVRSEDHRRGWLGHAM